MFKNNKADSERERIIGGMFGLEIDFQEAFTSASRPQILTGTHLRLATARSAFALLARTLRPATVWLPSYLCGVVLEAFADSDTRIIFYGVGGDLKISDDAWLKNVQSGDIVVFIDYFGFNLWNSYGKKAKERGAWVVEDACQAMLNLHFSEQADYVIASPRKFIGVPDGGILSAQNRASLPPGNLPSPPVEWWLDALKASQLRAEFDRHGGDREWFELFRKTDPHGPVEPTRMSELSSLLLDHANDYGGISASRRQNFSQLAAALPEFAMFCELPDEVVPLGFPVRVRERDNIALALREHEIYPPVHWPIQNIVPEEYHSSHRLSLEIMTLPCDQRYSSEDMTRLIRVFKSLNPLPTEKAGTASN